MDIKDLEGKKLSDLRVIATAAGIINSESLKKADIIDAIKKIASDFKKYTINNIKETFNDTPLKDIEKNQEIIEIN